MKGRALVNAPTWAALDGPVLSGDCIDVMAAIPDCSVDAVVCDPPYGLEFMGKDWDSFGRDTGNGYTEKPRFTDDHIGKGFKALPNHFEAGRPFQNWCQRWAREALRVLKPGGHLLAFGGSRTYHRLACAVEDAGFEIRDSLLWLYGSGFPKSLDVSKAIDKAERGVPQGGADPTSPRHGQYRTQATEGKRGDSDTGRGYGAGPGQFMRKDDECTPTITASGRTTAPSTPTTRDPTAAAVDGPPASTPDATASLSPDAAQWQGWGTALKPSFEPIVVARKPLAGTVAENVLEHGTGALNIDACRLGTDEQHKARCESAAGNPSNSTGAVYGDYSSPRGNSWTPLGRWPANVVLSEEAAAELDTQSGESSERPRILNRNGDRQMDGWGLGAESKGVVHGDSGGASRFFLTVKPDTLCVRCGLPLAPTAGNPSPPSEPPTATAPANAQGKRPPASEVSGVSSDSSATTAAKSSRTTQATATASGSTAQTDAASLHGEPSAPVASGAENLCERCATATAPNGAPTSPNPEGQPQDRSEAGPRSGKQRSEPTPIPNPASTAEAQDSTATTSSTTTPPSSSGSVPAATPPVIPLDGAETDGDLTRFRYQSKTSRAERNAGLEGFPDREGGFRSDSSGQHLTRCDGGDPGPTKNHHPTVKPINLMRWLLRLVTPPGGLVLDPFLGSGSTGCAAALEGIAFVGIEREPEYIEIAQARIAFWSQHEGREVEDVLGIAAASERQSKAAVEAGQTSLLEAA